MKLLALLVALFIIVIGLAGLLAPGALQTIGQYWVTPVGLYVAAALRVGIGLVLVRSASASRAPNTLRVLGVIALVAGLATPFVGVERARAILNWSSAQGPAFVRLLAGFALALGGFIVYAVTTRHRAV